MFLQLLTAMCVCVVVFVLGVHHAIIVMESVYRINSLAQLTEFLFCGVCFGFSDLRHAAFVAGGFNPAAWIHGYSWVVFRGWDQIVLTPIAFGLKTMV